MQCNTARCIVRHGRTSENFKSFAKISEELSLQLLRFSTTRLSKFSSDKSFAACFASTSSTLTRPTGVTHALMQLPRLTDTPLFCLDLLHNPSGFCLECRRFNTRTGAKTSPRQEAFAASRSCFKRCRRADKLSFQLCFSVTVATFLSNHALKRACSNSTRSLTGGSEGTAAASSDIAYQKCTKRSQKLHQIIGEPRGPLL